MSLRRSGSPFFYVRRREGRPGGARVDMYNLVFFGAVLALLALASFLYLRQSSEVATYARDIRELQRQMEWLHREITTLKTEVAMAGSLTRTLELGQQMGYRLPDAGDADRRLRIEYQVPPRPGRDEVSTPNIDEPLVSFWQDPRAYLAGQFQRLLQQMAAWLEAPVSEGSW